MPPNTIQSEMKKILAASGFSKETKFLLEFMEKFVTETICRKIDQKDAEIKRLSAELSELKKEVEDLKEADEESGSEAVKKALPQKNKIILQKRYYQNP